MRSYDMVVVGSGPAGQKAAVQAAKLSKRVAIVEKAPQLGGTSLKTGTLPSKTLKDTIEYIHGLGRRGLHQLGAELTKQLTLPDLMTRKDQVIETEVAVVSNHPGDSGLCRSSHLECGGIGWARGSCPCLDHRLSHWITPTSSG
jgi:NAD(P) transhydrogenase